MSLDWGIAHNKPFGFVTGEPQMSDVHRDAVDQLEGGLKWFDKDGTQYSSHPAKTQPKRPDYFGR